MKKLGMFEKIKIRMRPRYTNIKTSCFGFPVTIVDKSSFLSMYDEIFKREIYSFTSSRPDPRILDCGANIGLATIYFKMKYPQAGITAFEPDPAIFEVLAENIKHGKFKNVEMIKKGLSKDGTNRSFFSEGSDGGRIATSDDKKNIVEIETTRLSTYLDDVVDFLKIDIEGAEGEVLKECGAKLGNVQHIFIEYHSMISRPQELDEILGILTAAGFRYYIEHVGALLPKPFMQNHAYLGYDLQVNIFALKK